MAMYSYKDSLRIMLTPYIIVTVLWIPMTYAIEKYVSEHPLWVSLIADNIATNIVFLYSLYYRNTSIYDPYWHIPPIKIVLYFMYKISNPFSAEKLWVAALPLIYFARHNYNYFTFWPGMQYEDFRYLRFKSWLKNPILYWTFSYTGLHVIPTMMVYFGLFPTWFALASEQTPNQFLFYLGAFVAVFGVTFEAIADLQLYPWRYKKTSEIIDFGLWRYSRHPNYFGECVYWWGAFINALAYGTDLWFTIIGPVIIQAVFVTYSIPVMEKHLIAKRPIYKEQQKIVSAFIPWFRNEKAAKKQ